MITVALPLKLFGTAISILLRIYMSTYAKMESMSENLVVQKLRKYYSSFCKKMSQLNGQPMIYLLLLEHLLYNLLEYLLTSLLTTLSVTLLMTLPTTLLMTLPTTLPTTLPQLYYYYRLPLFELPKLQTSSPYKETLEERLLIQLGSIQTKSNTLANRTTLILSLRSSKTTASELASLSRPILLLF